MDVESLISYLNTMEKYKSVTKKDIAYISLGWEDFHNVLSYAKYNELFDCLIKQYCGVTIRENKMLPAVKCVEDLRTRIAWKLTGNTQPIFKNYGK